VSISVAADWLAGFDAGRFGLLDVFTFVDLFHHTIAGVIELTQEQLFVGLLILLAHGRSAAAENDVVFQTCLSRIGSSQYY